MKTEKIEELFEKNHSTCYDAMEARHVKVLLPDDLTRTVKQVEKELKLEWYRGLEKKLKDVSSDASDDWGIANNVWEYYNEIQSKIKELENDR